MEVKQRGDLLRIRSDIEDRSALTGTLGQFARQKPNRKVLGLAKFNLMVYNTFPGRDTSGVRHWIRENIGEPPVVFDSTLMFSSVTQMQGHLFNKGFLNNTVEASYRIRRRKVTVTYTAYPGMQRRIGEIIYPPATDPVRALVASEQTNSLIRRNNALDLDLLEAESKRIAMAMANRGFYRFDPGLLKFDVDTSMGQHVSVRLRLVEDTATMHRRVFYLRQFRIYTDYTAQREPSIPLRDTINEKFLYYYENSTVRSYVVQNALVMKPGQPYSREKYDLTLRRLSDLAIFKFVSIRYVPVGNDSLDCIIRLTPMEPSILRADLEGNNIEANVGMGVRFSYRNRNWLRRANKVEFNVSGGTEIPLFATGYPVMEGNAQIGFSFPRIFPGIPPSVIPRRNPPNPRITRSTRLTTGLNYQRRAGLYRIGSFNSAFGWEWRRVPYTTIQYNPFTVTAVSSQSLSEEFRQELVKSPQLRLSFLPQLITGSNATFVFTNPSENRRQSFSYVRLYGETAGFTLWALQDKSRPPVNGVYYVGDVPYANFVKFETDARRYFVIDPDRMFATRVFAGTGFHFWNSPLSMPYIKQYYSGGTSGIRAWPVRHLGPGAFAYSEDTRFVNQTGDIKLEGNLEYRYGIFGALKGALFLDGGNVWLFKPDPLQPGGEFRFNRFYRELALGGGAGFRLDFGFLVMRFDLAVPLRDPAQRQIDDVWLFNSTSWPFERSNEYNGWRNFRRLMTLNLAIGYPF